MKYYINYDNTNGKILGFVSEDKAPSNSTTLELTNAEMLEAQKHNNIAIDGDEKTFSTISYKTITDLKEDKIQDIKDTTDANAPVVVNGTTYNGGISSASAIQSAIVDAQMNGLSEAGIWDINDITTYMSIIEAEKIAMAIAKAYKEIQYPRQERIKAVYNVPETTLEEVEAALKLI